MEEEIDGEKSGSAQVRRLEDRRSTEKKEIDEEEEIAGEVGGSDRSTKLIQQR
jgi:hypothetical protein